MAWDDVDLTGQPAAAPRPAVHLHHPVGAGRRGAEARERAAVGWRSRRSRSGPLRRSGSGRPVTGSWRERSGRTMAWCSARMPGTQLDHHNVRRGFIKVTRAAGIGRGWTPRELRHSFVSLPSDGGMSIERTSHLAGHKTTAVTEAVCWHRVSIRPITSSPLLGSSRRGRRVRLQVRLLGTSRQHGNAVRDVAQLGRALDWGSRGRGFKSRRPDEKPQVDGLIVRADDQAVDHL